VQEQNIEARADDGGQTSMPNYPEYVPSPIERALEMIGVILVITLLLPFLLITDLVQEALSKRRRLP
jgi:hypothetical protein